MSEPLTTPEFPATKIVALGTLTASLTAEHQRDVMPQEVSDTLKLYLSGRLDQWFARKDGKGVIFIFNSADVEEVGALVRALPLGKHNLMTFELLQVGPLFPLGMLLGQQ